MRAGGHYSLFINILCEKFIKKKKKNLKVDEITRKRKGDEGYSLSPLSLFNRLVHIVAARTDWVRVLKRLNQI